ncbi:MAG: endonuclease/exonuclease/phosphatase family protein [Woeseiaceae bacterium]|nr:endonuclease/exonuclease/phosphatase family protein [Woeseiaceae bacterium]
MLHFSRNFRHGSILGITLLVSGCTSQPTAVSDARASVRVAPAASACIDAIAGDDAMHHSQLDADAIRVVNWNMQKGGHPDWADDLDTLHDETDILILQEASPDLDAWNRLAPTHHRSFAQGFQGFGRNTGVMTLSAAAPVAECDLVAREPWLRTRKAMLVTEYGLAGTESTLLVINIHGVNFSLGMRELKRQIEAAEHIIAAHNGPVLFSGDFNTWRAGRTTLIHETVSGLGLEALEYDADYRKRFLGWPLDHIYVRGLDAVTATTHDVDSSDHNPMLVEFRLAPDARVKLAHQ